MLDTVCEALLCAGQEVGLENGSRTRSTNDQTSASQSLEKALTIILEKTCLSSAMLRCKIKIEPCDHRDFDVILGCHNRLQRLQNDNISELENEHIRSDQANVLQFKCIKQKIFPKS